MVTTSHTGEVIVDVRSRVRANTLRLTARLEAGAMRPLDRRLWVDGNLSVDCGGRLEQTAPMRSDSSSTRGR